MLSILPKKTSLKNKLKGLYHLFVVKSRKPPTGRWFSKQPDYDSLRQLQLTNVVQTNIFYFPTPTVTYLAEGNLLIYISFFLIVVFRTIEIKNI